jgi:site-specific DNA-methyltransferase (adenine-specific)
MHVLADGSVDLIAASPPYYPGDLEPLLRAPVEEQTRYGEVEQRLEAFAASLHPVFVECRRVLRGGGVVILQTKDIRYGRILLPLAARHRGLAESVGFRVLSRVFWLPTHTSRGRDAARRRAAAAGHGAPLQVRDVEEFLVMSDRAQPVIVGDSPSTEDVLAVMEPLWVAPPAGGRGHPHASPPAVVRRLLRAWSRPGDLVVDPFAGGGTIVREAKRLGRRAIGFDIDPRWGRPSDPVVMYRELSGTTSAD